MFSANEEEVIQATARMNEVEFQSPGSTILTISDMQRTQSNGIKRQLGHDPVELGCLIRSFSFDKIHGGHNNIHLQSHAEKPR